MKTETRYWQRVFVYGGEGDLARASAPKKMFVLSLGNIVPPLKNPFLKKY